MNKIKVVGKQNFMGKEIKQLEGGFGENQRIISAKEVANIHDMRLKEVNKSINRLIEKNRIKENIDYINILSWVNNLPMNLEQTFGVKQEYLSRTKSIFVLSERGYSKLIKSMDDDTSWDIMDKLIDEYFTMRKIINSDEELKAKYLLKAVESNGEESAIAIKMYSDLRIKEENKKLTDKLTNEVINPLKRDLEHTEDVVLSLTSNISLMEKRQRITQIVRYGSKKYAERYTLLYEEFSKKFHVDVRRRLANAKERGDIKKSVNMMEYICSEKYLNKTNELYDLACKLFEGDFIQLLDEWRDTVSK